MSADDETGQSRTVQGTAELSLDAQVAAAVRARLSGMADEVVAAIIVEVPAYAGALTGRMGTNIRFGVETALGRFLDLAVGVQGPGATLSRALKAVHGLGAGEARAGRSLEALLAAYRVGARVSWRGLSEAAVAAGLPAGDVAKLAEAVFAYIDELSAASAAGHAAELATTGRIRERRLEELGRLLLSGAPAEELTSAAERAEWVPPRSLTVVLLPEAQASAVLALVDDRTLLVPEERPATGLRPGTVALLVADADGPGRVRFSQVLTGRSAVLGPSRPWIRAAASYRRALRTADMIATGVLDPTDPTDPTDSDDHLTALVLHADPEALADLRTAALAPLGSLRPAARQRLTDTLRLWLLHHGRREAIAAELYIHPQTVRYRVGQLRELFGERLDDPHSVLELTIALAGPGDPAGSAPRPDTGPAPAP